MEGALVLTPACPPTYSRDSSSPPPNAPEISDHQSSPSEPAPQFIPPPPPPPPPPPLLPPPPPPAFAPHNVQRRSMKKVNWDAIPSQRVLGKVNVWTSQRPQKNLTLNVQRIEELFSHEDTWAPKCGTRVKHRRRFTGLAPFPSESQVSILDSKKSMNIGIFLKHCKRPVTELVEDIRQGNWLKFGAGKLKELCKLVPEDSEVRQLLSFSGDLSLLPEADQFMVRLVKVPGYAERLTSMLLREEFFPLMKEMKNSVSVMTNAANELLHCDDLHSVIRLVLKAGNYMNAGGYSGDAIGFRMTSLLKLADTKANKPGMNLMHYVAKQAEDIDAELLTFSNQLSHVGMASRVCKEEVNVDFQREVQKIKDVKMYASKQPGLLQQMETFLMTAEVKLANVESSLQELNAISHAVAEYFCEDPALFKLEECCTIFHSFCKKFDIAVKENREREAVELRRKRSENFHSLSKRCSISSNQETRPDPETSSLESVLHSFLSSVPEGLTRCRKSMLSPVEGSPTELSSRTESSVEESDLGSQSGQERSPEEKQAKLQEAEELDYKEARKIRVVTRKVLHLQSGQGSLCGDQASHKPRFKEREQATPVTPRTPRPRTRDFVFLGSDGNPGSPWTILSPFTCPRGNMPLHNRRPRHRNQNFSISSGDDLDGEAWQLPSSPSHSTPPATKPTFPTMTCPLMDLVEDNEGGGGDHTSQSSYTASSSLPDCPSQRALSQRPVLRSNSLDETRSSAARDLRLWDLFQRTKVQRTRSYSGSGTESATAEGDNIWSGIGKKTRKQIDKQNSGFMSFFKRIGNRCKPEKVNTKTSDT
ncbi:FH2 domain containing 3 [Lampris incognitus]|uniref:FH2 domain containing 3 n=1 Tax=Lampris incognitus TaxID=2546036 RepID=UPI0024B5C61A|nr:FH2 domain containing 3 [Lampris incognitus]